MFKVRATFTKCQVKILHLQPQQQLSRIKMGKTNTGEKGTDNKVCCDGTQEKLKILAIHGYRQNGDTFRAKTGSFRKLVHKFAQFTYITAPHKVIPVESLDNIDDVNIQQADDTEQYGWWFNRDDRTFRGIRKGGPAIGFEDSVRLIEETFEEHGPFDGLLGFSQGACFVGLLCDLQHRGSKIYLIKLFQKMITSLFMNSM